MERCDRNKCPTKVKGMFLPYIIRTLFIDANAMMNERIYHKDKFQDRI